MRQRFSRADQWTSWEYPPDPPALSTSPANKPGLVVGPPYHRIIKRLAYQRRGKYLTIGMVIYFLIHSASPWGQHHGASWASAAEARSKNLEETHIVSAGDAARVIKVGQRNPKNLHLWSCLFLFSAKFLRAPFLGPIKPQCFPPSPPA